ncbi:MAG: hypothetical protein HY814_02945 [Candidatus Riflebacteria bacterium]|nr:hypothetical protein [Candidatus Riflebacteria bacterium]
MTRRVRWCMVAAALAAVALAGCIQERTSPDDPPALVTARINFFPDAAPMAFPALVPPPGLKDNSPMGLRAHIVMTGFEPHENDNALVNNDGHVVVATRRLGPGYFVVRGAHYDLGFGPVNVGSLGTETPVTMLRPFDTLNHTLSVYQPPLNGGFTAENANCDPATVTFPRGVRVMPKEPGRAKFVFFGDDPVGQLSQGRVDGRGNDSPYPVVVSVYVIGDFNKFRLPTSTETNGAIELLDDGSQFCPVSSPLGPHDDPARPVSGDERAGDRVFTRYVHFLPPGDLRYCLVVNQSPLTLVDPYHEGGTRVRIVTQDEVREFAASVITVK